MTTNVRIKWRDGSYTNFKINRRMFNIEVFELRELKNRLEDDGKSKSVIIDEMFKRMEQLGIKELQEE